MITRLRHLLFDNALLKLASLAIAILMWYGVAHEPIAEISLRLPIEFLHPPEKLDYSSDVVPQAQLRLRGPARLLRDLPQDEVRVMVDLRGATPGEHTYDLNTGGVRVPHDIEVMQITPSRLRLVFDTPEIRQVAARPRIVGAPPPGYQMVSVVADPSTFTISGPSRHVNAVEDIQTDAVDVTGVAGQTTFETSAYLPDPMVQLKGSNAVRVTVTTAPIPAPPPAKPTSRSKAH